jgi:L-asparaginase
MDFMKKGREKVLIIATGGTIESPRYPDGYDEKPVFNKESVIPALFERGKFNYTYEIKVPFLNDSRYITDKDRKGLVDLIRESPFNKIIISHGTQTLSNTHAFLQGKREKFAKKTIVLFGANMPSNQFQSDASINLGFALAACLYAPANVYLAMNGILLKSLSCKASLGRWRKI